MIKVLNNIIPFKGYIALTAWPFIFVRKDISYKFDNIAENHENIHGRQQLEFLPVAALLMAVIILVSGISWWFMLVSPVIWFLWYGIEYLIRDLAYGSEREAYRNISFEQEAYMNEEDMHYLENRRMFAWVKYIGRKTYEPGGAKDIFNQDNF